MIRPGLRDFDFSLFKNNPVPRISEAFIVQFRWEVFNIFNHANFNPPPPAPRQVFSAAGVEKPVLREFWHLQQRPLPAKCNFALKSIWYRGAEVTDVAPTPSANFCFN